MTLLNLYSYTLNHLIDLGDTSVLLNEYLLTRVHGTVTKYINGLLDIFKNTLDISPYDFKNNLKIFEINDLNINSVGKMSVCQLVVALLMNDYMLVGHLINKGADMNLVFNFFGQFAHAEESIMRSFKIVYSAAIMYVCLIEYKKKLQDDEKEMVNCFKKKTKSKKNKKKVIKLPLQVSDLIDRVSNTFRENCQQYTLWG